MSAIHGFNGEYRFLSNFHVMQEPIVVDFGDGNCLNCYTLEHAYQAMKATTFKDAEYVNVGSPSMAKRRGRQIKCRKDWDSVKLDIMEELLMRKFSIERYRKALIRTFPDELVEVNRHNDLFWGTNEDLEGDNNLGILLMRVRDRLRSDFNKEYKNVPISW
tara:strand:- start:3059 stop:3541 length:483 start_codon:yes stop_codon:yes gene_type:complete